jgi:asparagine synthase (glutamine-hydrolysing)
LSKSYDERVFINEVVNKTRVYSYKVYPQSPDLFEHTDSFVWQLDEPFVSTSMYAQWCVFKLAKEKSITVTLDGQGADELMAGYHSYFHSYFSTLLIRREFFRLFDEIYQYKKLHGGTLMWTFRRLLDGFANFRQKNIDNYHQGAQRWAKKEFLQYGAQAFPYLQYFRKNILNGRRGSKELLDHMLYDMLRVIKLPSLLRYEDRNSMAHSTESRLPFLDYRIVEFIFKTPHNQKIRKGLTKYIFRNAMKGILPESVRMRIDKMGFPTPEAEWFYAVSDQFKKIIGMLSEKSEIFDAKMLNVALDSYLSKKRPYDFLIWRWFNLAKWIQVFEIGP